ncbi:MAG: hypothetical protein EAZ07_01275 [Cytophagales bacterium]|nr:MAG: hypothetical protein EAZ07_01275 [Cytophagales bacterium]
MLIETQYLPCIDFFIELLKSKDLTLETSENYQKQSYRNRTKILGPHKIETLTIPVLHQENKLITSTKIDYSTPWVNIHLLSIKSAYGRSPFFEYYFHLLEKIYLQKIMHLFEFNQKLLTVCLQILDMQKEIKITEAFSKQAVENFNDCRNLIHPKKPEHNIDIISNLSYTQTFGKVFVKNLSIIDLIFNEGKNSKQILQKNIQ